MGFIMKHTHPFKTCRLMPRGNPDPVHTAFRWLVVMLTVTSPVLATEPAPTGREPPPHNGLKPPLHGLEEVGYLDVHLEGGFWGPRLEIHHRTTLPHVIDKLEERHHITNFDAAARVVQGGTVDRGDADADGAAQALEGNAGHPIQAGQPRANGGIVGHSAFDSDVHKALEGACYTLGHTPDPALRARLESILDRILAAQEKDGYLVSYYTAKEPDQKWANMRLNHEDYNAGHFFEFAVAHHQLDGNPKALEAAKRFADHIDGIFGPGKRYEVGGHQEIELALIRLYRATGETHYLNLCRFFLEERGHLHGTERKPFTEVIPRGDPVKLPGEEIRDWRRRKWSMRNGRMQDHKPILEQTEAVGHAVRAGYMYSAMADVDRFSPVPVYGDVLRKLWEDVVFRKMYITGGVGTAQYGDEGFGDPYLLPNKTYCESCSSIAHVFWQHRMNLLTGEAKYADVMELVLYNSALSGMSLSGDSFFYQNPLESRNGDERSGWIGLACCPTNLARFTPQIGGYLYARGNDRLFVNLFAAGAGTVTMDDGSIVKIRQETDYPWNGGIKLALDPEKTSDFDLCVRIPGWAMGRPVPGDLYRFADPQAAPVALKVNGDLVTAVPGPDGYVHLKRSWKAGDQVELNLPMPVRRVFAHENVEADRGKVALMRGPVVYCLEGVDNLGVDLFKVTLPRNAKLTSTHKPELLHGVTVIQGQGLGEERKPVDLTAIPYFAWANREKAPMMVWIQNSDDAETGPATHSRWSTDKANPRYARQPQPE